MAEKEERIYVRKYGEDNPCDTCDDTSGEECDFCVENYEWNASISRQEAIERMAKSVYDTFSGCAHITPFEQVEDKYKQGYYKRAEAALNALLEEDK